MRCVKFLAAALLVTGVVVVADAAPWNAGWKIYHLEQPTVSRRAYSYAPAATVTAAPVAAAPVAAAPVAAAPAPVVTSAPTAAASTQVQPRSYRSNSYQPAMNTRGANSNHARFWKEAR